MRAHVALARARRNLIAELQAKNQELEAFSYSISHELRAPMRAVEAFSQVLAEEYAERLDDQARDYVRRVRGSAQRMAQMIDDLLRLAHVSRGALHRTTVDVSAIANEIGAQLRQRDSARVAAFHVAGGLTADADPGLLRTVMENLLGNAWKFTARRAEAVIEVGFDGSTYFVRDNGVGFDQAYADNLFRPFQRLHTTRDFEGSGIGLATVQRIVARHGGRVWAEGMRDRGATLFFTL